MNFEKKIEELHDKAMELADLGFISKKQGKQQEAIAYFSQAYKSEEKAANLAHEIGLGQPTVGILFRSAITLASDASDIGKITVLENGKSCTEYFAFKDALPVKTVCPE